MADYAGQGFDSPQVHQFQSADSPGAPGNGDIRWWGRAAGPTASGANPERPTNFSSNGVPAGDVAVRGVTPQSQAIDPVSRKRHDRPTVEPLWPLHGAPAKFHEMSVLKISGD